MCDCQNATLQQVKLRAKVAKISTNLTYAICQNSLGMYYFIELNEAKELNLNIIEII